jgi:hypothetical protein
MSDIQIILSGVPTLDQTQYFTVEIPPNSPVSMMLNIPYSQLTTQKSDSQMMGEEEAMEIAMGEEEAMAEEAAMSGEEEEAMSGEEEAMEQTRSTRSMSLSAKPSNGELSERQSAILSLLNKPSNSATSYTSSDQGSQTSFSLSARSTSKTIGQTLTDLSSKPVQKPTQASPGPSMKQITTNFEMAKPLVTIQQTPIQQEYNFVTNRSSTNNNPSNNSNSKMKFSMSNASLSNNKQTQQLYL